MQTFKIEFRSGGSAPSGRVPDAGGGNEGKFQAGLSIVTQFDHWSSTKDVLGPSSGEIDGRTRNLRITRIVPLQRLTHDFPGMRIKLEDRWNFVTPAPLQFGPVWKTLRQASDLQEASYRRVV